MADRYRFVGPIYDWACRMYSGNQIYACKVSMLNDDDQLSGRRILFAGAGQGADAIHAAERGAHVTIIDISPTMLEQVRGKLITLPKQHADRISLLESDILSYQAEKPFDTVVANFFLNVFDREKMLSIAKHLLDQLRDGGEFVIGDFKPSSGTIIKKNLQRLYWYSAVLVFNLIAGNAIHRIYDYEAIGQELGLKLVETKTFTVAKISAYYALRFSKQ